MEDSRIKAGVPLWRKYSLSIQEAAEYYGIGEKRIRQIISENRSAEFALEVGVHTRIKRELFESIQIIRQWYRRSFKSNREVLTDSEKPRLWYD